MENGDKSMKKWTKVGNGWERTYVELGKECQGKHTRKGNYWYYRNQETNKRQYIRADIEPEFIDEALNNKEEKRRVYNDAKRIKRIRSQMEKEKMLKLNKRGETQRKKDIEMVRRLQGNAKLEGITPAEMEAYPISLSTRLLRKLIANDTIVERLAKRPEIWKDLLHYNVRFYEGSEPKDRAFGGFETNNIGIQELPLVMKRREIDFVPGEYPSNKIRTGATKINSLAKNTAFQKGHGSVTKILIDIDIMKEPFKRDKNG